MFWVNLLFIFISCRLKYLFIVNFLFCFFDMVCLFVGKWVGNVLVLILFFCNMEIGVLFFVGEILKIWLKYKFNIFCLILVGCRYVFSWIFCKFLVRNEFDLVLFLVLLILCILVFFCNKFLFVFILLVLEVLVFFVLVLDWFLLGIGLN